MLENMAGMIPSNSNNAGTWRAIDNRPYSAVRLLTSMPGLFRPGNPFNFAFKL
jgi:hypothetical protein